MKSDLLPTSRGRTKTSRVVLLSLLAGLFAVPPLLAQEPGVRTAPLSERERSVHLLSRATFGVRAQDVERVIQIGRDAWIEQQLRPDAIEPLIRAEQPAQILEVTRKAGTDGQQREMRIVLRGAGGQGNNMALANKLERAIRSERQLEQVMTDFWFNHFSVNQGKRDVPLALADYDDTIRRNVFGRFRDLLGATARHPSMLLYLDNFANGVPASGATDAQIAATRSVNENYARELLELHTLGVDGGYTQKDVTEVARAFTGWSVPSVRTPAGTLQAAAGQPSFLFQTLWHDPDEKIVLGRTLAAGRRLEDGEDVLDMLARHPATARHVATKLVSHFVADDPPADLVEEIARVFVATDGDLAAVTRALFTDERFYDAAHYRAKFKRPFEFVVSALRATGAETAVSTSVTVQSRLAALQHLPYAAPEPTGYPTRAEGWMGTGAMLERMNLAREISQSAVDYFPGNISNVVTMQIEPAAPPVTVDPWSALGLDRAALGSLAGGAVRQQVVPALFARTLPGAPTERIERIIMSDLETQPADAEALLRRAIALVLGSPEFQRY